VAEVDVARPAVGRHHSIVVHQVGVVGFGRTNGGVTGHVVILGFMVC
jgi:hypothetical protein